MQFLRLMALAVALSSTIPNAALAQEWARCADEGAQCRFAGVKLVRYGASGEFRYGTFTEAVPCSNAAFGDPAVGRAKACWTYQTAAEAAEEQEFRRARRQLEELRSRLQERDQQIENLRAELRSRERHIDQLEAELQERGRRFRRDGPRGRPFQ
jgi:peptidoglycan hydrolase CwlO-like protein